MNTFVIGKTCCALIGRALDPQDKHPQNCQKFQSKHHFPASLRVLIYQATTFAQQNSHHVRTRQGQDSQEGGIQEHQGRPAVSRGPHRSLPEEGQGALFFSVAVQRALALAEVFGCNVNLQKTTRPACMFSSASVLCTLLHSGRTWCLGHPPS